MQDPYALEPIEEPIDQDEPPMMEAADHGLVIPMGLMLSPDEIEAIAKRADLQRRVIMLQRMARLDNVAEAIEDERLAGIGEQVVREYRLDRESRNDWETRARRAMDLARQKKESKSFPWDGSSNVKYPLLTTASLQFAARAYPAIVDGQRVVKCQVMGYDEGGSKADAADRISQHMSFQLLYEVETWEQDVDTLLHQIPIVGCAFKKIYPDAHSPAGFCDDMVSAFDLVVNQSAKSLETVPRITHVFTLYPHEIGERKRSGRFRDVDLSKNSKDGNDDDAPHTFVEQHRYIDLDDDGTPEPWIVTVHEDSRTVVRIVPCFAADDLVIDQERGTIVKIPRKKYFVKIPFIPDPEGGFYDVGFGHLLEPLSDVIDTTINQMMDAGTLQNAGGGFIGAGVDLGKGKSTITFKPGQYRTVSTPGSDLRQAIVNMDHPGPSKTLFELLSLMIDSGKDIAAIQDILVGDMPRNQTATATMAMIEQGLKVFTAIYKRIFRALREEFKIIYEINRANSSLQMGKYVALLDKPVQVVQADYMGDLDVMPVSDPATITDMQRMAKAQIVLEEAKNGNQTVDIRAATRRAFEAARIDNIEEVLPPQQGPTPQEQITLAGALAEVEKMKADIDKVRAETEKTVIEAVMARMQAMIPVGAPVPVTTPQFAPPHLMDMPQAPPPPGEMPPMGGGGMPGEPMPEGMPPEMMGGPDQSMPSFDMEQGLPPELMDQIAAEQMAASDAMPFDGLPQ